MLKKNLSKSVVAGRWLTAAALFLAASSAGAAADPTNTIDAHTPPGLAGGPISGSFPLSGFESVNMYNGNVSIALPLLAIGGRGEAGYTMTLAFNSKQWRVIPVCPGPGGPTTCTDYANEVQIPQSWTEPGQKKAGYSPGSLQFRSEVIQPNQVTICAGPFKNGDVSGTITLTRLSFTTPDGAEHPFLDASEGAASGGRQAALDCNLNTLEPEPYNRGTTWISTDGLAATFESTNPILDCFRDSCTFAADGTLKLRGGMQYKVVAGNIERITDRNGNIVSLSYVDGRVTHITDSLGRVVDIDYDRPGSNGTKSDLITYTGFGGVGRSIQVDRNRLSVLLRDSGMSIQTPRELFSTLNPGVGPHGGLDTPFDPMLVEAVLLPDGSMGVPPSAYRFAYNPYAEIAEIVLPTRGRIEYEYTTGDPWPSPPGDFTPYIIGRKADKRRAYDTPQSTVPIQSQDFGWVHKVDFTEHYGYVNDKQRQPDGSVPTIRTIRHSFYGNPEAVPRGPFAQLPWEHGREFKTETLNTADIAMRTVHQTWEQMPGAGYPGNPRMTEKKVIQNGKTSRATYKYDIYNNVTDTREYGYDGVQLRHKKTIFLTNREDYIGTAHIRNLPQSEILYEVRPDDSEVQRVRTDYIYDDYGTYPLTPRSPITGHDPTYGVSYATRGNRMLTKRWLSTGGTIDTRARYDIAGNVTETRDARLADSPDGLGFATTIEYDGPTFAFPTRVTNAADQTVTTEYDFHTGKPTKVTDPNLRETNRTYADAFERLTRIEEAKNGTKLRVITIAYDNPNRKITQLSSGDLVEPANDPTAAKLVVFYDGLGREIETRAYENATSYVATQKVYDMPGRLWQVSNPFRASPTAFTTTSYDLLDRPLTVEGPDGATTTWGYQQDRTTVTDSANKVREITHDAFGRTTRAKEDPAGLAYTTDYTYDVMDNLTGVTQGQQTRTFIYNSVSWLRFATNPESGTIDYGYDGNGNLRRRTDARGRTTVYTIDSINRVAQKDYYLADNSVDPETASVFYHYDSDTPDVSNSEGRLIWSSNGAWKTRVDAFDPLGQVLHSTQEKLGGGPSYQFSYAYNPGGDLVSETYPSGRQIITGYDSLARATSVTEGTGVTYADSFVYSAHGGVKSMKLGNTLEEAATFNSRLQPTSMTLRASETDALWSLTNRYWPTGGLATTNNGNVMGQTISTDGFSFDATYTYDALNRLKTATEAARKPDATQPATWWQIYDYDRYGNRAVRPGGTILSSGLTPKVLPADISPTTNRLSNVYAQYDDSGNVTWNGDGWQFRYDAESRQIKMLTGANPPMTKETYVYDGEGKRVQKISESGQATTYIYDVFGRLASEDSPEVPSTEGRRFFTTDHLGSTRVVTNADGAIVSRHDYLPFGEEVPATYGGRGDLAAYGPGNVRLKFTGKEHDATSKLDYFGARYLGSAPGRFTSPDPSAKSQNNLNPQSWNRYTYVLNSPLRFVDPLGLWALDHNDVKDDKGKLKRRQIVVRKSKEGDDAASLAKQLGFKGKAADKFAAQLTKKFGDSDTVQLSKAGGIVGRTFEAAEQGVTRQIRYQNDGGGKTPGPGGVPINCSTQSMQIAAPSEMTSVSAMGIGIPGANKIVATLGSSRGEERTGDVVRYGEGRDTHFANVLFTDDDGKTSVFSRSGKFGQFEIVPFDTGKLVEGYGPIDDVFRPTE